MSNVLITGVNGQVGSYQADLQLAEGNTVFGLIRRTANPNLENITQCLTNPKFNLIVGDITDASGMCELFRTIKPDYCYHYAAQSHVHVSFSGPASTLDINIGGTLNLLEAIRHFSPLTKFFFAASSEMFGSEKGSPMGQNEETPFMPNSPYATSKVAGFHLVRNYRESYGIFALSGITFNTESPRRGLQFVTRKITNYLGRYKAGLTKDKLQLGNLSAKRDWGFAGDTALAAYLLMKLEQPQDCVIATNETFSIYDFIHVAFGIAGLPTNLIEVSNKLFRPNEVHYLCGDYAKLAGLTGWSPSVRFFELVELMLKADMEKYAK